MKSLVRADLFLQVSTVFGKRDFLYRHLVNKMPLSTRCIENVKFIFMIHDSWFNGGFFILYFFSLATVIYLVCVAVHQ